MKTPEEFLTRGKGNFINCTDYDDAIQAMKDYAAQEVAKFISSKPMLADSLPLSELKQTLYEVNTLISGWNATEAEWSEWDKEVQQKVNDLQAKLDGKEAVNFR